MREGVPEATDSAAKMGNRLYGASPRKNMYNL